jgi:hypothetical protein
VVREAQSQVLSDLAIVVGAVYQQVIEPTQAGRIPKRIANKLSPLLHGSRPSYYEQVDNYLDMIFTTAKTLQLIRIHTSLGQKARYMPGPKLEEWANLQPFEQVRALLQLWCNPSVHFWSDVAGVNYQPAGYGFNYYMDLHAAREALLDYITEECQPGKWYALESFLQTIKARNPMLLRERSRYAAYSGMRNRQEVLANWENADGEMIAGLLASTLHEFGLVTTGYAADADDYEDLGNPVAFQFTGLAAEVLWDQHLPAPDERVRTLIVQPNFELLLLQPDYPTLYEVLPFARVEQVEMVSRLTLTQESMRRGVEAGWSVERSIQILQERSQKELPQNVLYTLQDWGRLYKDATVTQVILLEVGSESVADEICASSKFRALGLRRLGPRAIAVGDQVSLQVLRSTLEKDGVILHIQGDILSARDVTSASTYYGRR